MNEKKFEPTLDEPTSNYAQEYQDNFDKTMVKNQIHLTEIDKLLDEKKQSLKKKIFSLPKMEALVFSDPKLTAVYDEMAEDGEEKYGYHYNETIMNIIFNDYVLNSSNYLQKYKMAVPKKKKRRDKSGINALRKNADDIKKKREELKKEKEQKMNESTVVSNSGAFVTKAGNKENFESNMIDTEKEWKELIEPEVAEIAKEKKMKDKGKKKSKIIDKTNIVGGSNAKPTYSGGKVVKNPNNNINESTMNNLEIAKQKAQKISKEEGVAQHVNMVSNNKYVVSDWYDADNTIISYENGKELYENDSQVDETTSASSVAGGGSSYVGYAGPAAWGSGNLMYNDKKSLKEDIMKNSNYLVESEGFEKFINELNEEIDPDMISTKEDLNNYIKRIKEKTGKGLNKYHIPTLAGDALYTVAIQLADRMLPLPWDQMSDTNSMWDYIDENGGMKYEDFIQAVKEAVNDRLSGEDMGFENLMEHHANTREEKIQYIIKYLKSNDQYGNYQPPINWLTSLDDNVIDTLYKNTEALEFSDAQLNEKAKSKAQQKFMGMVHAYKKGDLKGSEVSDSIKKAAKSMTDKETEDFASTKYDKLPEKVDEESIVNEYIVTVKHDNGTIKIKTTASSEEEAKNVVIKAEGCPESSILDVKLNKSMNEHHLETRDDKLDFILKAGELYFGQEAFDKDLQYKEWSKLPDERIHKLYLNMEKILKQNDIDPTTISIDEAIQEKNNPDNEWEGVDANLEISLFEYGFVASQPEEKDYSDEWFVIYKIDNNNFGTGWIREAELNNIVSGNDWANEEDVQKFLSFVGQDFNSWLNSTFINKMSDVINYWGVDNIMGTEYSPMDKEEALQKINQEIQETMIDDNEDSMKMKQPINVQTGDMPTGMQSSGPMNEDNKINNIMNEEKYLKEINKDLSEMEKQQDRLKNIVEDRKTSSLVNKDRLGNDNEKNFKKDLKHSGTKEIIDTTKELEWKDQQTEVDKDPQKLGKQIEKESIKNTNGDSFENVGNSTNNDGNEIPKRNLTDEETNEVDLYRKGLGDFVYDNEPDERYKERMKRDMGEKEYKKREDRMDFEAEKPMYNKDSQPIDDGIEKDQFSKYKSGWNKRMGINEAILTGKYVDEIGKTRFFDFNTLNIKELETPNKNSRQTGMSQMFLEGLGNTYDNKVQMNESIDKAINEWNFYTDGKNVFVMKKQSSNLLKENEEKDQKATVNEQFDKMKHLLGYNPKNFTNTKNIKL